MSDLREGEFELDGYRFGTPENDAVVLAGGFDSGSPDVATNDFDNPVGDGGRFGRDYLRGPTFSFTLGVRDDENVDAALAELARVWRNEAIRTTPGQMSTLRFMRNGTAYRVYGRPRTFGLVPQDVADDEWREVEADFKVAEPVMYTDEERSEWLYLNTTTSDDGLVLPETLEWILGASTASGEVVLNVQTLDPAPFVIEVYGPATGALSQINLEGPGWVIDFDTLVLNPSEVLTIDTRAMTATVGGVSVAGSLSRRSRLRARLWSGASAVKFSGTDPSGTAKARIRWRATTPIL